jgi:fucose 4-O-acetylase-like acetyltransferase
MRVADDSWWRYSTYTLAHFRLPLFTVISGVVYAMRPIEPGGVMRFMQGKVRRLMVPFVAVGGAFALVQIVVPGTNSNTQWSELPLIYVYPIAQFWYLLALFWVFCVIVVVDALGLARRLPHWVIVFAISMAVSLWSPRNRIFAISGAMYLVPYFILGVGLYRFRGVLDRPRTAWVALPGVVVGMTLHQAAWFKLWDPHYLHLLYVGALLGPSSILCVYVLRRNWAPLAKLGAYSYAIYLLHIFGTAGSRIALQELGVTAGAVVFLVGLGVGVGLPIVAELIAERSRWLRFLLLGRRLKQLAPPPAAQIAAAQIPAGVPDTSTGPPNLAANSP